MLFADIIVDVSHEKVDRSFQYRIPEHLADEIYVGVQVDIPFGAGNRKITGYVIRITDKPSWDLEKMKDILKVNQNTVAVESKLIQVAWFIREHYGATMNQALKTVIPVKQKVNSVEKKQIQLAEAYTENQKEQKNLLEQCRRRHATAKIRLLEILFEKKTIDYEVLTKKYKISASVIKGLEKEGILKIWVQAVYRDPLKLLLDYEAGQEEETKEPVRLTGEQEKVVCDIMRSKEPVHLIHGITGSGKTRVYIELIRHVVAEGKQAIVMIPEISLTYQTVKRFFDVFGNRVSIINSKLSQGERYDQFERAKNGDIDIIIGPRSAVFTPFSNLGIIIMDEEHEGSYKSESVPKYHARETAIYLAGLNHAKVVLGSATPSVDAYYKAERGEYVLHELKSRASGGKLAAVTVVDLRRELEEGNRSIFSRKLQTLIEDRLEKKEQIMLFINRRGYAGFVSCRSCGEVIKCIHCDVSLTYHHDGTLVCHYCGYTIPMPRSCPKCSSKYIARFGTGTEKVQEAVQRLYPRARVLRMDADTTAKKGAHEKLIKAFARHEADILVGTQMIVKGHDFPNVTLVGVIAADLSLYASDYRSSERTFQLLTQAEGRAGRGKEDGEALIQTYNPENFSIEASAIQDYETFYKKEILYRTLMGYPPVLSMMAIMVTSESEEDNVTLCMRLKETVQQNEEECVVIGPADASVAKIKDVYRKVLYLKHPSEEKIIRIKEILEEKLKTEFAGIAAQAVFDLNPVSGY